MFFIDERDVGKVLTLYDIIGQVIYKGVMDSTTYEVPLFFTNQMIIAYIQDKNSLQGITLKLAL
jgi:hypothetical protein